MSAAAGSGAAGAARSYRRVLIVWVLVLAALYLFQQYFD